VEVVAEVFVEVATEVAAEVAVEVVAEVELVDTGELKTEVEAMDAERKNSYVVGAQSLVESIYTLLLR
jgi:hypothetical protein